MIAQGILGALFGLLIGASEAEPPSQRPDGVWTRHVPASTEPGALAIEVTYYLWLPPRAKTIRGVIVHQHGCGEGAERGGETAIDDLHWRALAAKRDCALFGSSYRALGDCASWFDPERGSAAAFTQSLDAFGKATGHPELSKVPWALWGHSGGAVWAYKMFEKYPERTLAVFLRSGRPTRFEPGKPGGEVLPSREVTRSVPVVSNVGLKEREDARFGVGYADSLAFFSHWRKDGARVAFAPDPKTSHECGNGRYLAIPFFDACLAQRLPEVGAADLSPRPIDDAKAWLGDHETGAIAPRDRFQGDASTASWLPDETCARAWHELVTKGEVTDPTPPASAPEILEAKADGASKVVLTWSASPDFESGIRAFAVYRDGQPLTTVTPSAKARFAIPQFQQISYHDTPEAPVPPLRFTDENVQSGTTYRYELTTINGAGQESPRSAPVSVTTPER